jgi:hypothetical protein
MEGNSRYSSFDHMRNSTPPPPHSLFLTWPVTLKKKMAIPEQKAFCVLQFGSMNQLFPFAFLPATVSE